MVKNERERASERAHDESNSYTILIFTAFFTFFSQFTKINVRIARAVRPIVCCFVFHPRLACLYLLSLYRTHTPFDAAEYKKKVAWVGEERLCVVQVQVEI